MLHYATAFFYSFISFTLSSNSLFFPSLSLPLFFCCLSPLFSILFSSLRARSFSTEFSTTYKYNNGQADRKWRGSLIARHCCGQGRAGWGEGETSVMRDDGLEIWRQAGAAFVAFNWSPWRIRYTILGHIIIRILWGELRNTFAGNFSINNYFLQIWI